MNRFFLTLGALAGATGVMLGAFGAHSLESWVSPERLAVWRTGVDYQMWHASVLILIGIIDRHLTTRLVALSAYLVALGVLIFSGSLYLLVLLNLPMLGMVTPIGGVLMILGWITLILGVWRSTSVKQEI